MQLDIAHLVRKSSLHLRYACGAPAKGCQAVRQLRRDFEEQPSEPQGSLKWAQFDVLKVFSHEKSTVPFADQVDMRLQHRLTGMYKNWMFASGALGVGHRHHAQKEYTAQSPIYNDTRGELRCQCGS
jgi:hypothetical protein